MATQQNHISFIKEIYLDNKNLFKKINLEQLYYGSVYPDIFYVNFIPKQQNFSWYLHGVYDLNFGIAFGKQLLKNAVNDKERSFAIGFISHFVLDKYVHGYLKRHKLYDKVEHMVLEFYLQAKTSAQEKVIVAKQQNTLIDRVMERYYYKDKKKYKLNYKTGKLRRIFFKFVCNILFKKTLFSSYLHDSKRSAFKNIVLGGLYYFSFRAHNYKVKSFLYPNYEIKQKYLNDLLEEYEQAKVEFVRLAKRGFLLDNT
jgi:hypothetical protein